MNGEPTVAVATRRAALALHAMCDADRAWMLASLPAAHRRLLEPLLDELQRLGLPRDRELAEGVAEQAAPAAETGVPAHPLKPAQAAQLAAWLAGESAPVAARMLAACPGWHNAVLDAMAATARAEIVREMQGVTAAPALASFLRAQALQRLRDLPVPRRGAWWQLRARNAREAA